MQKLMQLHNGQKSNTSYVRQGREERKETKPKPIRRNQKV